MTANSPKKTPALPKHGATSIQKQQKRSWATIWFIGLVLTALCLTVVILRTTHYAHLQLQQLKHQVDQLSQQDTQTQTTLDKERKALSLTQAEFQTQLNAMDKRLQSALRERMYASNDWLLLKVRYYLELAQINAQWSDNLQTTSELLQQADVLLATLSDRRALPIRQTIAKEIAACKAIPPVDIAAILSELDASLNVVATLPLKSTMEFNAQTQQKPQQNTSPQTWRDHLNDSLTLLQGLVVIRHHNEEIRPLPSPAYESMLREGIRLDIQEAQWAVLHHNEAVYQLSLAQALNNIQRSFEPSASTTSATIKQLQTLAHIHLVLKKPVVGQSLPLLKEWIESNNVYTPTPAGDHSS